MAGQKELGIGALAKAAGTGVETVRFYEKIGILPPPPRSSANYRRYGGEHVRRLVFVRRMRELGFSLDTVRAMLALSDHPAAPCEQVDRLVATQLLEVERKIADLQRLRQELANLSRACEGGLSVADCRIVEALLP
jgi:DNA-binding transcriptional MerR regulator